MSSHRTLERREKAASRRIASAVLGAAALALGACASLPVTTDFNPSESLATCHTYTWAQEHVAGNTAGQPAAFGNPVNADRLRVAIESNLAAKGIQKAADPRSADCVVGYSIGSRLAADWYGPGWGFGYGWGRRGWGYGGFGYDYPYLRDEGRIAVDVFDAKSRQAIWHASVDQNVVGLTGPRAEAKIDAAAAAIFAKFPGIMPVAAPAPAASPPRAST